MRDFSSLNRWRRSSSSRYLPVPYRSRRTPMRLLVKVLSTTTGALMLWTVGAVGAAGAIAAAYYGGPRVLKLVNQIVTAEDDSGVCAQKPTHIDVILVDASDPLISTAQKNERDLLVNKFLEKSEMGRRVAVARLSADPMAPLEVIAQVCDPGNAKELSILRNTPRDVQERRKREYTDKIKEAIKKAYIPPDQPLTPLVEGLSQLFKQLEFFGTDSTVAKRVLVITDTMQNSSAVTSYRAKKKKTKDGKLVTIPPYRVYESRGRGYVDSMRTNVVNTQIVVGFLYRPNQKQFQTTDHKVWFKNYLASNGAQVNWVELW